MGLNLQVIKTLCKAKSITLQGLAQAIGVPQPSLSRCIKANKTTTDLLNKIAEYFKVSVAVFFEEKYFTDYLVKEMLFMPENQIAWAYDMVIDICSNLNIEDKKEVKIKTEIAYEILENIYNGEYVIRFLVDWVQRMKEPWHLKYGDTDKDNPFEDMYWNCDLISYETYKMVYAIQEYKYSENKQTAMNMLMSYAEQEKEMNTKKEPSANISDTDDLPF